MIYDKRFYENHELEIILSKNVFLKNYFKFAMWIIYDEIPFKRFYYKKKEL